MYSSILLISLAALAGDLSTASSAALTPPPAQATPSESLSELNGKLQLALQRDNFADTLAIVEAMIAHPDYPAMPERARRGLRFLEGAFHLELDRPEIALPSLIEATEWSGARFEVWATRIEAHRLVRDMEGAAGALAATLRQFPDAPNEFGSTWLLQFAVTAELDDDAAFDLRMALLESGWRHEHDSHVWLTLIDDLLTRDRALEAKALVERISGPSNIVQLAAMRRYDPIRPAGAVDVLAVLEEDLAQTREQAAAPGATVSDRNRYVSALLQMGRFAEALGEAEAILAGPAPDAETDPEGEHDLAWTMDSRARSLFELGRSDEAIDQMRTAAARSEFGYPNVSQTINLGWLNLRLGQHAAALAAVADVSDDNASPYGRMQADQVRACATHALGDEATATPLFADIEANWRDAPGAAYEAAACRADETAMTRLMIDMLNDPEHAPTGVAMMHDYLLASRVTDFDRRQLELHHRVAARPDVVAARDRVGRGFSVPTIGILF